MDNFEEKIRNSKECIEKSDVNNSASIYNKIASTSPRRMRRFSYQMVIKMAALILVLALMFTGGFLLSNSIKNKEIEKYAKGTQETYSSYHRDENGEIVFDYKESEKKTPLNFGTFKSEEELASFLTNEPTVSSSGGSGWFSLEGADEDLVNKEATVANANPTSQKVDTSTPTSSYKTNTQVENVDEADIVKVSGNFIFYLTYKSRYNYNKNVLTMFEEVDDELLVRKQITFTTTETIEKEYDEYNLVRVTAESAQDLYVTDRYLIVRIYKYEYLNVRNKENKTSYYRNYDYTYRNTFAIYDINTLDLVTTIETAGSNVSTRLIGNTLYVVNNFYDYRYNDYGHYLPYFIIGVEKVYPTISSIIYSTDCENNVKTYVSIYKIVLDEEITVSDLHVITPTVNNIYSSEKNIYLIRSYGSKVEEEDDYLLSISSTRVVSISIDGDLGVNGGFDVPGSVSDRYWIDEKDNYVRVVSTGNATKQYYLDKKYFYKSESTVFNQLTILKQTEDGFEEVSVIREGLGKIGERVRSARFNGDVVTVVTFRNTDPLYYIDISDPNNPEITSSLEVTGFSVYQHPYKDNYVIGFGYETNDNGRTIGYKITLFDISDKNNIKQVGKPYTILYDSKTNGTRYYYYTPDFFSDPKALFVNLERGIFGFREYGYQYYNSGSSSYYNYFAQYLVFKVDENSEEPFKVIVKEVTNTKDIETNDLYSYIIGKHERMVFINDNYYILSDTKVDIYKYNDGILSKVKVLSID